MTKTFAGVIVVEMFSDRLVSCAICYLFFVFFVFFWVFLGGGDFFSFVWGYFLGGRGCCLIFGTMVIITNHSTEVTCFPNVEVVETIFQQRIKSFVIPRIP